MDGLELLENYTISGMWAVLAVLLGALISLALFLRVRCWRNLQEVRQSRRTLTPGEVTAFGLQRQREDKQLKRKQRLLQALDEARRQNVRTFDGRAMSDRIRFLWSTFKEGGEGVVVEVEGIEVDGWTGTFPVASVRFVGDYGATYVTLGSTSPDKTRYKAHEFEQMLIEVARSVRDLGNHSS